MESLPLASLIIPVYNAEETLSACMESALNQSFRAIEIIAIDDASSDQSLPMLQHFAQKDARLRVIANPQNQGVAACRNAGITASRGSYLFFLDSDDFLAPQALELLLKIAAQNPCGLIAGNCFVEQENQQFAPADLSAMQPLLNRKFDDAATLYLAMDAVWDTVWGKLFKAAPIKALQLAFHDAKLGEDALFFWRFVLNSSDGFYFTDQPLYYYRRVSQSVSLTKNYNSRVDMAHSLAALHAALLENNQNNWPCEPFCRYAWKSFELWLPPVPGPAMLNYVRAAKTTFKRLNITGLTFLQKIWRFVLFYTPSLTLAAWALSLLRHLKNIRLKLLKKSGANKHE